MWWCVWVRSSRPCISCLPWLSLFRLACACALLVWLPFLGAAGLLSFAAAARCFVVVVVFLVVALVAWCLRFGPLFPVPPLPFPLGCLLVVSGPVSVLLVPPSGYLVVSATVRLSYLWYGVSWLIGSCLHSAPWHQRLRPCVGLCPLHHVVGVVHVPLAPSLRYSPSCDPVYPSDTAKAARARLLGLCCFLPPVLLPSRASALSFLAGLLLPAPSFCWALSARLVVLCLGWCLWLLLLCVFGLSSWRGPFCGLFGLFGFVVLFVPGWFLCFVFCFWWLLLASYWTGTLVYFDFPCTTKAFIIIGLVCLSADWTGSLVLLTSPVHLVFTLVVLCDYPQNTEVTKDGCRLLTLIIHTHPPL